MEDSFEHTKDLDVLIIGAGPTGLTMACELLRRGIRCRILDKEVTHGLTSRAMGVQARTLEVFDNMGIIDPVLAAGVKRDGINIYKDGRTLLRMDFHFLTGDDAIPYPYGVTLPQSATEELLVEYVHRLGGTIERLREITDLHQHAQGVVATIKNVQTGSYEQVYASWLIGCDGSHSMVRPLAGLEFEGSTYHEEYLLADVELDWERSPQEVYVWIHSDGQFAAMALPENRWRLFANFYIGDGQDAPPASLELFQRLMRERAGDQTTIIRQTYWLSNFRIHRRMVSRYRQQRVFLAGDAAHVHSPFGGQGLNTGIQDAFNLAWKLALVIEGKAMDSLLDTYTEERIPIARQVLQGTHMNTGVFFGRHFLTRFLRDMIVLPLLKRPFAQRRMLWAASELGVNYHQSSLSQTFDETVLEKLALKKLLHRTLQAGDRASDGRCLRLPEMKATTLFQEFRGTQTHLLLFDGGVHTESNYKNLLQIAYNIADLLGNHLVVHLVVSSNMRLDWQGSLLFDPKRTVHAHYGANVPSLYVIRPDGYIGFRCQPAREEPVRRYLESIFSYHVERLNGQIDDGIGKAKIREGDAHSSV
jgi:2-polyprenyl-6-methoxyphenol hydroxylase-like FAD-dependent oxidoreductase